MIKHIVMWKLEEVAEGNPRSENARIIKERLEALPGKIPEIIQLEVGINVGPGKSFDLALYSKFASLDDLKVYDQHPDHMKVREFIHKVITERAVVDYEA